MMEPSRREFLEVRRKPNGTVPHEHKLTPLSCTLGTLDSFQGPNSLDSGKSSLLTSRSFKLEGTKFEEKSMPG